MKLPGTVDGQPFEICACHEVELLLLDHSDQVQIDKVHDSRIFIAASSEGVFIRDCSNCTFAIACKQLRVRDSADCNVYLYTKTEPVIESSSNIRYVNP